MTDEPGLEQWGVYVHVPFCPSRCSYCDFAVVIGKTADDAERYVAALIAEWEGETLPPGKPHAVYFGGGTPSMLTPTQIGRILEAIEHRAGGVGAEVTLEVNPEVVDRDRLQGFRQVGVTRLSIGAQALQDRHLLAMNRGHRAADVAPVVEWAQSLGYSSISLDAIYGWPGQSLADWQATIAGLVSLAPDHLSLYQLQVEAHTALEKAIRSGRMAPSDVDLVADMADWAAAELDRAGYLRYEISSYAQPGHEGRLNRLYWTMNPYVAVGLGAHAFDGVRRWWNVRGFGEYLNRMSAGEDPQAGEERLTALNLMREYCWLGLRTVVGFTRARFHQRFGCDPRDLFDAAWSQLEAKGLVVTDRDHIRLTARGLDLANYVMATLIDAEPNQ